ncbi:thioredoxin domain-containing protein [bacterium]|nr:thioredoxin domain-containing protein [bacterium]
MNSRSKILMILVMISGLVLVGQFALGPREVTPEFSGAKSPELPASTDSGSSDAEAASIKADIARKLAEGKKPNRLIKEKSPYLLQHAFNPVDWYPWGDEAFEKARKEDKPIFLSVGYSTCYWCHVMEREVFENEEIAKLMNDYVVSIKVDREERPDVDRVYMAAVQAMTGSGGWPMSLFLTPDLKPFFGGTYIPPTADYGRPAFPDLVTKIHEVWSADRKKITESSSQIGAYLQKISSPNIQATKVGKPALDQAFQTFVSSYDSTNAGFGSAPKFPRPVGFNFLLRYYSRTGQKKALEMALETLRRMANGGMYDHIGGGFHRYSTDELWHVPHFEKMLYDQAQLAISYLEAYQITHDPFFANVARDIFAYVKRDMTHKEGGFYSAEDAESAPDPSKLDEKEEGAFYTWTKKEIDGLLSPEEAKVFDYCHGVEEKSNVARDPQQEFVGENILYVPHSAEQTARQFDLTSPQIEKILASARQKLFQQRERRPHPHLDDKILTSWNGLMISAFARASQVLQDEQYRKGAEVAAQFILDRLYDPKKNELLHRYRDGEARFDAHLEDYAYFVQGLLDLYESTFNIHWLKTAIALTEDQNRLFYDSTSGGFYDISGTDKSILIRTKEWYDGAEPTGNSIAILNLLRLAQMTGNQKYQTMAGQSLAYFGQRLAQSGEAVPQFLVALDFSLSKPKQIIIAGKSDDPHTWELLQEVHSKFIPNKILLLADGAQGQQTLASYIPFIKNVTMMKGKATAYICENYTCKLPTSDRKTVAKLLTN